MFKPDQNLLYQYRNTSTPSPKSWKLTGYHHHIVTSKTKIGNHMGKTKIGNWLDVANKSSFDAKSLDRATHKLIPGHPLGRSESIKTLLTSNLRDNCCISSCFATFLRVSRHFFVTMTRAYVARAGTMHRVVCAWCLLGIYVLKKTEPLFLMVIWWSQKI